MVWVMDSTFFLTVPSLSCSVTNAYPFDPVLFLSIISVHCFIGASFSKYSRRSSRTSLSWGNGTFGLKIEAANKQLQVSLFRRLVDWTGLLLAIPGGPRSRLGCAVVLYVRIERLDGGLALVLLGRWGLAVLLCWWLREEYLTR